MGFSGWDSTTTFDDFLRSMPPLQHPDNVTTTASITSHLPTASGTVSVATFVLPSIRRLSYTPFPGFPGYPARGHLALDREGLTVLLALHLSFHTGCPFDHHQSIPFRYFTTLYPSLFTTRYPFTRHDNNPPWARHTLFRLTVSGCIW
jgi:hypothetical protein